MYRGESNKKSNYAERIKTSIKGRYFYDIKGDATVRRGTTPTLEIKITGIDVSELINIYVTLKQYKKEITKSTEDITVDEIANKLYVPLSQEDTLVLQRGYVYVQMRAATKDGQAVASEIVMKTMEEILKEGVIT